MPRVHPWRKVVRKKLVERTSKRSRTLWWALALACGHRTMRRVVHTETGQFFGLMSRGLVRKAPARVRCDQCRAVRSG